MTADLSFSEIKKKIGEYLKTALNADNFDITFAKRETSLIGKDTWRINIEFRKEPTTLFSNTVAITIDATNGDILTFEKDKIWKF